MTLAGKQALVTGAGRGIGRGCALALARKGADLALNDRTDNPEVQQTLAEIRALGRRAELVVGDVFSREGCQCVIEGALAALGDLQVLVSNPAYNYRAPFLDYPPDEWDRSIAGTLSSGFHLGQLFARHRVARGGGGKIVFISSIHARIPCANSVAYNSAKLGLLNLSDTIANELLPHRVNVNAVLPGWIDTPGERAVFGDATIDAAGPTLPWGRLGRPDDIGHAVAFLCSDEADYITGTSLTIDGGLWLKAAQE